MRQIPPRFSWIDHRLVRDGHFEGCSCDALALYLFLLTVADPRGLSYYSQPSLMKSLKIGVLRFTEARTELIRAQLIAYQHPLYQVLTLAPQEQYEQAEQKHQGQKNRLIQSMRQTLSGGDHD